MFKALPIRLRSKSNGAGANGASALANGVSPRQAPSPDDPHAIGADGWLTAFDVKKSYRKRMVVKGVNLAVGRGESVGLLGPNGAGKTTVFYMIACCSCGVITSCWPCLSSNFAESAMR